MPLSDKVVGGDEGEVVAFCDGVHVEFGRAHLHHVIKVLVGVGLLIHQVDVVEVLKGNGRVGTKVLKDCRACGVALQQVASFNVADHIVDDGANRNNVVRVG